MTTASLPATTAGHRWGPVRAISPHECGFVVENIGDEWRARRCDRCGILEREDGRNNPCPGRRPSP